MLPKKILPLACSLALCATLLTACWNSQGTSSSSGADSSSVSGSSSSSSTLMGNASSDLSQAGSDVSSGMSDALSDMTPSSDSGSDPATSDASSGSDSGTSSAAAAAAAEADAGWATRLVNAANPLPEQFTVKTVLIQGYENRPFDARAAEDLEALLADAQAAGCKLYLVSAYRSIARQTALFERKTNLFLQEGFPREQAEQQAAQWVARPGTSEHNLGLAVDLVCADWYSTHSDLTADFEQTPAFAWLRAHCAEYGFILRYPQGKEAVTGVTYEPWHYRYVGREAAAQIMAQGLTLEEYTQQAAAGRNTL